MKRTTSILVFAGLAFVLAFATLWVAGSANAQMGGGGGGTGTVPTTGGANSANANQIVVSAQDVNNGSVVVSSFNAPADGWLLIQSDSRGAPGAVIGFAPVHAGLNSGVRIDIRQTKRSGNNNPQSNPSDQNNAVTPTLWASYAPDSNAANALTAPPAGIEQMTTTRTPFSSTAAGGAAPTAGQFPTTGGVPNVPGLSASQASQLARNRILVRSQDITANQVVIDAVNAAANGWVFIERDNNGHPGAVIGWAPVYAGINQGVRVDIQLSSKRNRSNNGTVSNDLTPTLWAVLVADPNASNPFATPGTDLQTSGGYAQVPFGSSAGAATAGQLPTTGGVTTQPSQPSTTTGSTGTGATTQPSGATGATAGGNSIVVQAQDIPGNQIVIQSVMAAQDGWVLIHQDNNGAPGAVIGWAPVFAGLNQNVRVDIQLSSRAGRNSNNNGSTSRNLTSVLWVTLNPDPSATAPFATPNAAVQTSGVLQAPFSSTAAGGVSSSVK